ncbi:hypothetical protein FSG49_002235 [Escherichia coli]|nr:hypothetical protein [Escherichia coli]
MNIYREPGATNAFVLSRDSLDEPYERIGVVSDDVSLSPVIPDEIYEVIAAYNESLLSTGFELNMRGSYSSSN